MGRFGSGRPSGRRTVEDCRWLDVNQLHRTGCLNPGWSGGWQWTHNGKRTGWINLASGVDSLRLTYRARTAGAEWSDVAETVSIVRVPCRFGGARPYFICPGIVNGVVCGRRVAKLYASGGYFLCRHCHQLAHASQGEAVWERALRRASKVRRRLGGNPETTAPFPDRPKGMWRRTYERLRDQVAKADRVADESFIRAAQRLHASKRRTNPRGPGGGRGHHATAIRAGLVTSLRRFPVRATA
jgi:hypothetical protein